MTRDKGPQPTRTPNPDAEFFKMFGVGCLVLLLVFACGWATIALFWLSR